MGCMFWVKFNNAFAYFVVSVLLARWCYYSILSNIYFECKTKLCLIVPGRHGKYFYTRKFQSTSDILNDIIEQGTSFLDCKHKHMMKSGLPPVKVRVLYRLPIEFHGFTNRIDF